MKPAPPTSDDTLDTSAPVRRGEALDLVALDAYLARALPHATGPLAIEQFPRGYSNLTYLLRKGPTELVLRRPPFGAKVRSGHDMAREYRVLCALHPVYPAPKPLAYCADETVLGAPFYVMERLHGLILRKAMPVHIAGQPELFTKMCESLVDTLARLHSLDHKALGLADLGNPEGYVRRQVEGWMARFDRAKTQEVPDMDAIGQWLVANMPAEQVGTIVHNDYKFDNVMLDPQDPTRIIAVLDWEMCTLGDPLMDLGTLLGYWIQADDDPVWQAMAFAPTMAPGGLTRQQLAARYGEQTGRDVSNMLYYYCFALLKIGVIVQQIFHRYKAGHTTDARFAGLDRVVVTLARTAVRAAESGRY